MKEDAAINRYFSDNYRFADLFNPVLFSGDHVVVPEELADMKNTSEMILQTKEGGALAERRIRDVVKKQSKRTGESWMILGLENQMEENYFMPVRGMLYDSLNYMEQVQAIKREHLRLKDLETSAEFLSGVSEKDRLCPVTTLVVYYGREKWKAPKTLHEMFQDDIEENYLKKYIPDYVLNLIEVNDIPCCEHFETDLRAVFGLLKYREEKGQFGNYLKDHEEWYREMSEDAYDVLAVFLKKRRLLHSLEKTVKTEKGGMDMCRAIDEMIEDGKTAGRLEGRMVGNMEGLNTMAVLVKKLLEEGRMEELAAALENPDKRKDLLEQYKLKN